MRKWTIAASALALHGCGGAPDDPEPVQADKARIVAATPYVDRLRTLDEVDRGLALRRAILDSGERCKRVERSAYQQDYENMSLWTARCSDSGAWALFIAPNGDVQVRACADAAELGLPECRIAQSSL